MSVTHTTEFVSAECIIQGLIDHYPQTITVFARHGLQCVGCYIAPFHTLADSAREHAVPLESLVADLSEALVAPEHAG